MPAWAADASFPWAVVAILAVGIALLVAGSIICCGICAQMHKQNAVAPVNDVNHAHVVCEVDLKQSHEAPVTQQGPQAPLADTERPICITEQQDGLTAATQPELKPPPSAVMHTAAVQLVPQGQPAEQQEPQKHWIFGKRPLTSMHSISQLPTLQLLPAPYLQLHGTQQQSSAPPPQSGTADLPALPQLPSGPVPRPALAPGSGAPVSFRGGSLPPLATTTAGVAQVAAAADPDPAPLQPSLIVAATYNGQVKDVTAADGTGVAHSNITGGGTGPTAASASAASSHAVRASLVNWLHAPPEMQQQQQQLTASSSSLAQQQMHKQPELVMHTAGHLQFPRPQPQQPYSRESFNGWPQPQLQPQQQQQPGNVFAFLSLALQQYNCTLSAVVQDMIQLQQGSCLQEQQQAATQPEGPLAGSDLLAQLPVVLQHLAHGARANDLAHAEALLLLLLPAAKNAPAVTSTPPNAEAPKPAVTAAAAAAAAAAHTRAAELDAAFEASLQLHTAAAAGRDPTHVLLRLQEYIADNQDIMHEVWGEWDADGDARLDPLELSGLVSIIPGLQPWEQGLILAVAAQLGDVNGNGCLSLAELAGVTKAFQRRQRAIALQQVQQQQQREKSVAAVSNTSG